MSSTLITPRVTRVLDRLRAAGEASDEPAKQLVNDCSARLGRSLDGRERADLCQAAPLSITPEVGELLYVLALGRRAERIVEFGTSLGFSTLHIAAAIRDNGAGQLITTELQPEKAERARSNLAEAGLADLVDVRVGDAMQTLADCSGDIDMLFLDGWNELYLPLLCQIEPYLKPGALVVADLSKDDPLLIAYRNYVTRTDTGYLSVEIPIDAGVVVSVRLPSSDHNDRGDTSCG